MPHEIASEMLFIVGLLLTWTGTIQQMSKSRLRMVSHPHSTRPLRRRTHPPQKRITGAKHSSQPIPNKVEAWNELAIALLRRARETADTTYLNEANDALTQGLKLNSSVQLQRTQAALMLSRRQYLQAKELV